MSIGPRPPDVLVALDNDVFNDWRFRAPGTLKALQEYMTVVKAPPAIPAVTVFEAMFGFENTAVQSGTISERAIQDRERIKTLVSECTVLPFNQDAAEIAAYIFPRLSRKERKDHWADMFIAATALAHDHGVATRNRSDFELIARHTPPHYPPLRIEIWNR